MSWLIWVNGSERREFASSWSVWKYDSLPSLLQKTLDRKDGDPIARYVTFLCATQLRDQVAGDHRAFFRARRKRTERLDSLLNRLSDVRAGVLSSGTPEDAAFLDWYEPVFLRELRGEVRSE